MAHTALGLLPAPTAHIRSHRAPGASPRPPLLAFQPFQHAQRQAAGRSRQQHSVCSAAVVQCFSASSSVVPPHHVVSSFLVDLPQQNSEAPLRPLPRAVENAVDDARLANPLARQERMGTGWFGVIMEYEGLVVEDFGDLHLRAWEALAAEEGKSVPPRWMLRRAEGMKNEQVIQEVFCWTRLPMEVRRLAARKEDLFRGLLGDTVPAVPPGASSLLELLLKNKIPVGIACSAPEARVRDTLDTLGLTATFGAIVTADDVYRGRPDPEAYLLAAQQLGRPPVRCVVIGNSNQSVEAARESGMAAVVVAGRHPVYELTAADLVVRQLDELSFVNLKQLFRNEELAALNSEAEPEMELEEEPQMAQRMQTMVRDW